MNFLMMNIIEFLVFMFATFKLTPESNQITSCGLVSGFGIRLSEFLFYVNFCILTLAKHEDWNYRGLSNSDSINQGDFFGENFRTNLSD